MRLLFGMILGAALTVGVAYVSDIGKIGPEARPMVNWDVVGTKTSAVSSAIKSGWSKLTADR